jgi:hypothetical protein
MNSKTRLLKLEQHRPKLVFPVFADMYATQTKATYDQWLLDNNIGLTQSMIDELDIKALADMYDQ